jgi:hypothetical protein
MTPPRPIHEPMADSQNSTKPLPLNMSYSSIISEAAGSPIWQEAGAEIHGGVDK